MTAIEVLTATVLASLMLGSVIGVLGSLARQQRVLRTKSNAPDWHQRLKDQLLWDLQNSRQLVTSSDRLRLVGFAGRDFANGRPTGRPTAIEYFFVAAADDHWLVRREEHLDARSNDAWRMEIVCRDLARLDIGEAVVNEPVAAISTPNRDSRIETTVPDRLTIRMFSAGSSDTIIDELFIVR